MFFKYVIQIYAISLRSFALNYESLVDVRDHATTCNGSLDQSVELFVTADSQLHVTRSNSLSFEVLAGIACELQNLSGQVLEDGSSVDC